MGNTHIHYDKLAFILFLSLCYTQIASATIVVSGLVEVDLSARKDFSGVQSSDISATTVEIAIDAEISEWVSTKILALYENKFQNRNANKNRLNIDEATITFGNHFLSATSMVIGQQYLPFGFFASNMISDPLTLKIGEIAGNALTFSYEDKVQFAAFVFNGTVNLLNTDNDNKIDKFGINVGYIFETKNVLIDIGVSYINSIGESGGLSAVIINGGDSTAVAAGGVTKFIAGIASHFFLEWGTFTFIADHVLATDAFAAQEIRDAATAKPSALNIEFGLNISTATTIAISLQQTVDVPKLFPRARVMFAISYILSEGATVSGEYLIDADYSKIDGGGDGDGNASAFTLQISSEF